MNELSPWRFVAARATGVAHAKSGSPCQDRSVCQILPNGLIVAAIADGAGSASLSDKGAELAVASVVRLTVEAINLGQTDFPKVITEAATRTREIILASAEEQGVQASDLASTLLTIVLGPSGGGALQIGDGVIVVSESVDDWHWVFWPQRGEFANVTYFLTDEDALDVFEVRPLPGDITDFALMTDGLEPLAIDYRSRCAHQPFFTGVFRPLIQIRGDEELKALEDRLNSFLTSERIVARTDDDVSLVIATRRLQSPD